MKSWIAWCRGNHLLIDAFKAVIHLEERKDQLSVISVMHALLYPVKHVFINCVCADITVHIDCREAADKGVDYNSSAS